MSGLTILQGHCIEVLRSLEPQSVQCVVTSPPYWGLRDYGLPDIEWPSGWRGQHGLEPTPQLYIENAVAVFREVYRVLRDDGTCWVNLGDCYATGAGRVGDHPGGGDRGARWKGEASRHRDQKRRANRPAVNGRGEQQVGSAMGPCIQPNRMPIDGLKPKDLVGMPWRVAFALQADGWFLRSDIIWQKPNAMPETVKDRPTKAHEYLFLFTKRRRYFYDAAAIKEPVSGTAHARGAGVHPKAMGLNSRFRRDRDPSHLTPSRIRSKQNRSFSAAVKGLVQTRNKRSVWTVATRPFRGAHFATFPPALITPCVLAGSRPGDVVLDPFGGSGTVGQVANQAGRRAVLIELNPSYITMAKQRCGQQMPEVEA